jgi:hypothetical protein
VTVAAVAVEEALLLLKIGFLVLLYLFLWKIVRTASRDLRMPQESFVLAPQQARKAKTAERRASGRLVVASDGGDGKIGAGTVYEVDSAAITVGRGAGNDIALEDDFASTFHARVEARPDGVWVEDVGSTNGTAVNGIRLTAPRRLVPGDVIRIGETDFRFER